MDNYKINQNTTIENTSTDFSDNKHTISDSKKKNTFSNFFRRGSNLNKKDLGKRNIEMIPIDKNNSSSDAENAANENLSANVDISVGQNFLESVFGQDAKSELTENSKPKLLKALRKLEPSTSADVLIYALGNDNDNIYKRLNELDSSLIETLRNNILKPPTGKADPAAAKKLLDFALGHEERLKLLNNSGPELRDALVRRVDSLSAENSVESALLDAKEWNRLNNSGPELRNDLVRRVDSLSAKNLVESALGNEEILKRLNNSGPELRDALVEVLGPLFAANLVGYALEDEKRWDRLNNSGPELRDALVRRVDTEKAAINLINFALADNDMCERLNNLNSNSLTALGRRMNPIDGIITTHGLAEELLKSVFGDEAIFKRLSNFGPNLLKTLGSITDPVTARRLVNFVLEDEAICNWMNEYGSEFINALANRLNSDPNDPIKTVEVEYVLNSNKNLDNLDGPRLQFLNGLAAKLGKKGKFHLNDGKLEFVPADA